MLSEQAELDWEGCLSLPDLRGQVPRPIKIQVEALDRQGKRHKFVAKDFLARVVQHECDHLDGRVFLDRMSDLSTLAFLGCVADRACKDGTVFVTITFEGGAAQADSLDVGLSLDGGSVEHETVSHTRGQVRSTLQVEFARGYPKASAFTVAIVATDSGTEVGRGSVTESLRANCHALSIAVNDASSVDGMADGAAGDDLAGVDLAADAAVADLAEEKALWGRFGLSG